MFSKADPYMTHLSANLYGCQKMTQHTADLDISVHRVAPYVCGYLKYTGSEMIKSHAIANMTKEHNVLVLSFSDSIK